MKPEEASLAEIRDKIWTTYKSRINAETRFKNYNAVAHILTAYFSLWLIIISVIGDYLSQKIGYFDKVTIALSVVVFALSLSLYGFRFSERAKLHRECYLRLQRLHLSREDAGKIGEAYFDILESFPNHAKRDYDSLIVEQGFLNDNPIKPPGTDKPIPPSAIRIFLYFAYPILFWLTVAAIAAAPIIWLLFVAR